MVATFIKRFKMHILCAFVLGEIAIYIAILVGQSTLNYDPVILKYSGLLLCLLTAASVSFVCGKDGITLVCAFVFTSVSDLFLLVLDGFYELGVSTFIVAQICYFSRIYFALGKYPYISLALRAALSGIAMLVLGLFGYLTVLTALVAVYFPMLVCNAAESVFLFKISNVYILFFVGLLLFIGCDICVGLNNFASLGIHLSESGQKFVGNAVWAFYLPSQVLIVASAREVGAS